MGRLRSDYWCHLCQCHKRERCDRGHLGERRVGAPGECGLSGGCSRWRGESRPAPPRRPPRPAHLPQPPRPEARARQRTGRCVLIATVAEARPATLVQVNPARPGCEGMVTACAPIRRSCASPADSRPAPEHAGRAPLGEAALRLRPQRPAHLPRPPRPTATASRGVGRVVAT